jgi:nitroimidazol reductase NimA-like FMN-containing flavoprotein (pyridoxamine 5'-phosphate oxidase superfamily)
VLKQDLSSQRLRELPGHECLALLASVEAGRIAYEEADGPVIVPVNHVVDNGTIVIRTSPASQLARGVRNSRVAYEVDDLEARGEISWSVQVRGAVRFLDPEEIRALDVPPEPQAEGLRNLYLRIVPRSITGRRLLPG